MRKRSAGHTSQYPEGYVGQTSGSLENFFQPEESLDSAMYRDQIASQSNRTEELTSEYSSSYSVPS